MAWWNQPCPAAYTAIAARLARSASSPRRNGIADRRHWGGHGRDTRSTIGLGGVQGVHSGSGCMQIVVKQARQRRTLLSFAMADAELASIAAQEVMHAEPSLPGELDKVRLDQGAGYLI